MAGVTPGIGVALFLRDQRCIKSFFLSHPIQEQAGNGHVKEVQGKVSNNSQEPSKYEVQTTKLNQMPVPDKQREEFAEEMVEDAKEAFSKQQSNNQE